MVAFAAAVPWIASAVGSMLPMIVDSFRSGKSPEEAQKMIAPQRQAMIERLIGSGMNMQQAEAMTDEAMADELAKAQLPEPMNPWLTAALAIGGGIGGYKLGAKFAGKGTPTPDVGKEAKIDTPAEQAVAKPASGQAPSATPAAPTDSPMPARMGDDIAAKLESRAGYDAKRMSLDNSDPSLVAAVDEMVPAMRPRGPFPEFLPGEFQSRTPSASLRPWESMPEVEGAMIRKSLSRQRADPRGIVNLLPPEGGPFPSPEAARAYSSMYRYEGG
jgi:hypothetical protein